MRILIAEDDLTSRTILAGVLKESGHEVIATVNGADAWDALQQPDAPRLVILDWMMPKLDGLEVLRRVRARQTDHPPYIIMLTVRGGKADIIAGLDAGANDYLSKPFDAGELRARINVGRRMVEMQGNLAEARQIINETFKTAGKVQILFVDDEQDTLNAIERLLRKEMYAMHFVTNGADALDLMAKRPIHIIVTDMKMPGMDGLSLLRHVKSLYPDTVRMALSSYLQIGQLLPCINTGEIYRYITKPANEDLKKAIQDAVKYFMAKNQSRLLLKQLEEISIRDALTGLFNRRQFDIAFKSEIRRAVRYQRSLCFLIMDIDHFKLVNDTFGHPFGDFVLQELCGVLGRVFRDSDTLYRYGGEEFCALMPETQCTEGETVAIRVLEAVRKHVFDDGQQSLKLTISIGGAIFPDCDQESLIQSADQALYRAKREGRNRVIFS